MAAELTLQSVEILALDISPGVLAALLQRWSRTGEVEKIWKFGVESPKDSFSPHETTSAYIAILSSLSAKDRLPMVKKFWERIAPPGSQAYPDGRVLSKYFHTLCQNESTLSAFDWAVSYLKDAFVLPFLLLSAQFIVDPMLNCVEIVSMYF